ncbi:MAG: hypothetical protein KGL39_22085 [Patescibacteria group bacterium]|nr:hypothetical protein [Patescibacteria group bacterium]
MKPIFRFEPVGADSWYPHETTPQKGELVRLTKTTLGQVSRPFAYVSNEAGGFAGMVLRASLVRVKKADVPSWKVAAYERGYSRIPVFNALRFATMKEAAAYASDLFGRWFGCERVEVFPSSDPVKNAWREGALVFLEEVSA